jgi:hypothetical protein
MTKPARKPISLRLRADLHDRVWGRAEMRGKTFQETVNDLLEQALDENRPFETVFGSRNGFLVARALISAAETAAAAGNPIADGGMWLFDAAGFNKSAEAIHRALEIFRPSEARDALAKIEPQRKRSA